MKYIKKFEASSVGGGYDAEDRYWKISLNSPEYEISINKVVSEDFYRKNFLKKLVLFKGLYPGSKYFYLSKQISAFTDVYYHYDKFPFKDGLFMGKVEVTKEEIDEWNMEHDAEKYNL